MSVTVSVDQSEPRNHGLLMNSSWEDTEGETEFSKYYNG